MTPAAAPAAPTGAGEADAHQEVIEVGLMRLCGRDLAIPAAAVREVVPLPERLHPDFSGTGACAGSILVRGRAIPVLDIAARVGFSDRGPSKGVVVILRSAGELIGLVMDGVSGLARITMDRVQPITIAGSGQGAIVASSFAHGDALVGLLDPAAVFALPGVPHAQEGSGGDELRAAGIQSALVLVSVADVNLALYADAVVATVPGIELRPSVAPASKWIGTVEYLGYEVPVIGDLALFGLNGRAAEGTGGAVTILRFDETRMVGLKIDRVRRIFSLSEGAIRPLSAALREQLSLFRGAVLDDEDKQNLLLERDALARSEALRMIGMLCRKKGTAEAAGDTGRAQAGSVVDLQPFVVFRTGGKRRAAALASINQVIPFPEAFTAVSRPGSALQGIASYRGAPLPLFDLTESEAGSSREADDKVVLVVEKEGAFSGLVVEGLETIARSTVQRRPGPDGGVQFIQARVGGQLGSVALWDLEREAEALVGRQASR